jgi:hypothetical protein
MLTLATIYLKNITKDQAEKHLARAEKEGCEIISQYPQAGLFIVVGADHNGMRNQYQVIFGKEDGEVTATCSCTSTKCCKHIALAGKEYKTHLQALKACSECSQLLDVAEMCCRCELLPSVEQGGECRQCIEENQQEFIAYRTNCKPTEQLVVSPKPIPTEAELAKIRDEFWG